MIIIIQLVIILALTGVLVRFLSSRSTSQTRAWKKVLFVLLIIFAIFAVIQPEMMNDVAELVGIGRGADLLLYGLAIAFIFQVLSTYIKTKDEQKRFVALARKMALLEAKELEHNKRPNAKSH